MCGLLSYTSNNYIHTFTWKHLGQIQSLTLSLTLKILLKIDTRFKKFGTIGLLYWVINCYLKRRHLAKCKSLFFSIILSPDNYWFLQRSAFNPLSAGNMFIWFFKQSKPSLRSPLIRGLLCLPYMNINKKLPQNFI